MKTTMKSQMLQLTANVLVLSAMSASAAIRCVDVSSSSAAPPYTNWTTAATAIQDAVDAAVGVGVFELRDAILPSGQRFYRAVFPAY